MTHTTRILNFLHHPDTQHGAALLCIFAAFPRFAVAIGAAAVFINPLAHATAFVQCFCQWVGSTKMFNYIFP